MRPWSLIRAFTLFTLVLSVLSLTSRPAAAAEQSVIPAVGAPGGTFSFFATGFAPGEQVSFWTNDPAAQTRGNALYRVTASSSGRADWSWTAPSDAALGNWTMVAYGVTSRFQAVIAFKIGAAGSPPNPNENLPILASPQSGSAGTTFAFYATGFEDREVVGFWATSPDHRVVGSNAFRVMSNRQGRADWTWTVPEGVPPGTWLMTAKGESSFVERSITIEIR